jgi:peptide/nickel transport system substrate-binding protein
MRKKIMWVGLCVLLVAAMVISSCNKTTTASTPNPTTTASQKTSTTQVQTTSTTKVQTTTATTAASTEPVYGGSLSVFTQWGNEDPSGFDGIMTVRIWSGSVWVNPFTQWLLQGDIEKYGPRGNNTYAFQNWETIPDQFLGGCLAESWEIQTSPSLTFTFHLRHGVMWTGNQNIGMAPREFNADDVIYSENRALTQQGAHVELIYQSVSAPDKWTVIWQCNKFNARWVFVVGSGMSSGAVMAHEQVEAKLGGDDWHDAVGTGPFILTDYTEGQGATYTRNPNYWESTTIKGQQYKLPFIQTLYYPIIPDKSTEVAALRTGKIDWWPNVSTQYADTLKSSAPALIQTKVLYGKIDMFDLNQLNGKYMTNINLRRALMIGTDFTTIANLVFGGGEILAWPLNRTIPEYTPLNQLPAADQALYTYDPVKAKQMIAAEGYPNGFPIQINIPSNNNQARDEADALVSMWAQIGVTGSIVVSDATTETSILQGVQFPDMIYENWTVTNPLTAMSKSDSSGLGTLVQPGNPLEVMYRQALAEPDAAKRSAIEKTLAVLYIESVAQIPMPNPFVLNCYWPWINNYYDELDTGYYNGCPIISRIWINQGLKKSLGKG